MTSLHLPAGSTARDGYTLAVDPASAGWGYSSLRILDLAAGGRRSLDTGDSEWIVLPLSGGATVTVAGEGVFELAGRDSVFSAVTDFAYLPRDARASIASAAGGRFALAGARAGRRLPARYGPAHGVPVELRGAGSASRQVNNFAAADVFEADRLIAVEVLTPSGNWSSFPPHKHDQQREGESELEEIYYFELGGGPSAIGYQRVYSARPATSRAQVPASAPDGGAAPAEAETGPAGDGPAGDSAGTVAGGRGQGAGEARSRGAEVLAEVRSGDCVLIPEGWHGPSMAVPGYDMYYLNVMAGPAAERSWLICDDPAHAWVRSTWPGQAVDPRLPLYEAPALEGNR